MGWVPDAEAKSGLEPRRCPLVCVLWKEHITLFTQVNQGAQSRYFGSVKNNLQIERNLKIVAY